MPHPSITAETTPDKPAYIMAGSGEIVTYGQLDRRSNQAAHLFRSLGLKTGDHIGIMMYNCRQFLEICWGAQRAGLIYTPISTHLKKAESLYILKDCNAKAFISCGSLSGVATEVLAASNKEIDHFLMVDEISVGYQSWDKLVETQASSRISDESHGVSMLYSSGTTGQPKGIFIPPKTTDVHAPDDLSITVGDKFGFGGESVYLTPAPLYHAAPLRYTMMNIYLGGTCVIMESFDPEKALQAIERYRVTHSQWVPIMFVRMLKLSEDIRRQYDMSSMQLVIHAAAPCPVEIKQKMIDWWGEIIIEYYAASEDVGATLINSKDWLSHRGSVGQAYTGRVRICDDDGNELTVGEVGTIYFSDKADKFDYHNDPKKTAEVFNDKGWATSGDVGYLDQDDFLYLTDRKDFMIISGGVNIYPQEIENLIITHDKVADVAVFGIPHAEFGESVQAVVQTVNTEDATEEFSEELLTWVRQRLSSIKTPRHLDFTDQLPRMDNGKLYKRFLVEEYKNAALT